MAPNILDQLSPDVRIHAGEGAFYRVSVKITLEGRSGRPIGAEGCDGVVFVPIAFGPKELRHRAAILSKLVTDEVLRRGRAK